MDMRKRQDVLNRFSEFDGIGKTIESLIDDAENRVLESRGVSNPCEVAEQIEKLWAFANDLKDEILRLRKKIAWERELARDGYFPDPDSQI
jgi:hypothetical protein